MKAISRVICVLLVLTLSCKYEDSVNQKPEEQIVNQYEILSGACGTIIFIDKIGNDLDTSLDSLKVLRENFLIGGCPDNPCHTYYIEKIDFEVNFDIDNREFYGIKFIDSTSNSLIFAMHDVIDTKGNLYFIEWCPD